MTLEFVFNELSLEPPAENVYSARLSMVSLVQTVLAAAKLGVSRAIRTHTNLNDVELTVGYSIRQWRNDPNVDRELRGFFRTITSKTPYLVDLPDRDDAALMIDCFWEDKQAIGLKVAYMLDTLSLSVPLTKNWNSEYLGVIIRSLSNDGELLPDEAVEILNASTPEHIQLHENWIRQRLRPEVTSGIHLWNYRAVLYPNLEFCDAVEDQLAILRTGDERLAQINRLLKSIDAYSLRWQTGRFDASQILGTPSPETEMTLSVYSLERTFSCPDGVSRVFSWHQKMFNINWRIHFFPDEERKQIIVGYIGRHLPTSQYRT